MRWKRLAWASCLAPLMGGCLTAYHPHRDHVAEHAVAHAQNSVTREIHRRAREAWQSVRSEFPRKVFTPEFRDGFIDGYSDYLDRGGDTQPPAVPPLRYTQNPKYLTPEGHALMRDYFLGFKYGTDVALATGQRQYLTVPVLLPDDGNHTLVESQPSSGSSIPPVPGAAAPVAPTVPQPLPNARPTSNLPAPRPLPGKEPPPRAVTAPVPFGDPEASKFGAVPLPPGLSVPRVPPLDKEPSPSAFPAVPLPGIPSGPSVPMSGTGGSKSGVVQAGYAKLPEPPLEIRDLPDDVPTPPVLADLPELPPLPVNHPDPVKK